MNLYKKDYTNPTDEEKEEFSLFVKSNTIGKLGELAFKRACIPPKALRYYQTLFPNNYLDVFELQELRAEFDSQLECFKGLLDSENVKESDVLKFINSKDNNSYFIIGSLLRRYNFGHHGAFLFPEFQLGNTYRADFLIIGTSSDGYEFIFIELESPKGRITINNGYLGEVFRKGLDQIDDWKTWLNANFSLQLKETWNKAKKKEDALPDEFTNLKPERLHYVVIAGRREDFTEKTRDLRLRVKRERNCLLLHYDNLLDDATNALIHRGY
jgi:hypothetical protein